MLCIVIRGVYVSLKKGVIIEFIRLFGICFTVIITLHYYKRLGLFLSERVMVPDALQNFFAFILLFIVSLIGFVVITNIWSVAIKKDRELASSEVIGCVFFSLIRLYLLCALILSGVILFGNPFLKSAAMGSISANFMRNAPIKLYKFSYDRMIVKLTPSEPFNQSAVQLLKPVKKKDR